MLCDFDYFCANSSFIMDPSLQSAPVSAPFVEFVESEDEHVATRSGEVRSISIACKRTRVDLGVTTRTIHYARPKDATIRSGLHATPYICNGS